MYIKDATGGLAIYDDATSVITTTYNNGDVIGGGVLGRKGVNAGMNQMIPLRNTAAGTSGTPVQPISVTMPDLLANFATYEAQLVKLDSVHFTANGSFGTGAAGNLAITQAGSNMLARNHFNTFTGYTVTTAAGYDIIGFAIPFNADRQIAPRDSINDIVKLASGPVPSLTVNRKQIEFGSVRVDEASTPEIVTVTGVNLVNIIYGEMIGNDDDFAAIHNDGWNPTTGGTISITFVPQTVGDKRAVLYIRCAETNIKDSIILTGTAAPPVSNCPREFENSVVLYPNPVEDVLYIQAEQPIELIVVYSMNGQIVAQQFGNKNSVDVSKLPRGTYVVRNTFDNGQMLSRVIVK
jgi:hypothetical protein